MDKELAYIPSNGSACLVQKNGSLKSSDGSMRLRGAYVREAAKFRIGELVRTILHKNGQYNDILSFNHAAYCIRE